MIILPHMIIIKSNSISLQICPVSNFTITTQTIGIINSMRYIDEYNSISIDHIAKTLPG